MIQSEREDYQDQRQLLEWMVIQSETKGCLNRKHLLMCLHPEVWIRTVIQCAREERVEQKQQQRQLEGKAYLPGKVHLQEKDQKSLYSDISSIPVFQQKKRKKTLYILDFPSSKPFPLVNQLFLRNALLHPFFSEYILPVYTQRRFVGW